MVVLGEITAEELAEVKKISNRRNALQELYMVPSLSPETRNAVLDDLAVASQAMQLWWANTAGKYGWSYTKGNRWEVDFQTCAVTLY